MQRAWERSAALTPFEDSGRGIPPSRWSGSRRFLCTSVSNHQHKHEHEEQDNEPTAGNNEKPCRWELSLPPCLPIAKGVIPYVEWRRVFNIKRSGVGCSRATGTAHQ